MTNVVLNMRADVENPATGIDNKQQVAANLAGCLADSYLLMVKTQGYHWNAVGPLFHSIHALTEEHYEDIFEAVDIMAERIRALGYPAPSSITDMIGLAEIREDSGNPTTEEMVVNLISDHEVAARRFRDAAERADNVRDLVTADLLTARISFHEKAVWMLRAILTPS